LRGILEPSNEVAFPFVKGFPATRLEMQRSQGNAQMTVADQEGTGRFSLSVLQRHPGGKGWVHKVTDGKDEVCCFNASIEEAKRRACDYLIRVLSDLSPFAAR
jgi:hypothetical protein